MVIKVADVKKARDAERATAKNAGVEEQRLLELQYIADALECIRGEFVGVAHLLGSIASRPQK
jgi:hypothetical protein